MTFILIAMIGCDLLAVALCVDGIVCEIRTVSAFDEDAR